MRFSWPKTSIIALYQDAIKLGQASVELNTKREAELFSFALWNAKRRNKSLKDSSFKELRVSVDNTKVTIYKPNQIEIKQI